MKRLAHRGYSDLFPENTMSAFEQAVNSSFEGIETDVQMTIDGELLLLHDDKINRTSNGKGVLRVYKMLKKDGTRNVYLRLFKNARHELLNEVNKLEVYNFILDWLDKL